MYSRAGRVHRSTPHEVAATRYEAYDRREVERPVRLDKTEGVVVIEGRAYPAREIVEALAQSGYAQVRAVGDALVLGRKKITPIFKSPQERALASLCHGSLAYCCPLSKRCAERDRALEVLGLTPDDYERLKQREHHQFLDAARGAPPLDDLWAYGEPSRRAVNRPAVDVGFGSDDYRTDFDRLEQALRSRPPRPRSPRQATWSSTPGSPFGAPSELSDTDQTGRSSQPPFASSTSRASVHAKTEKTTAGTAVGACSLNSDDSIEGIGSLFRQGELSPFSDDSRQGSRRGFCFSCGRTIEIGTTRCPYCGALQ